MKTKSIFLDGKMVKARKKLIDSLAPGVVQGKGVFETMRIYNGKIFALQEHLDRLTRGLRVLKIRPPYSKKRWGHYLYQTIKMNSLKNARIRLALWKEGGNLRIAIVCQEMKKSPNNRTPASIKAMISTIQRKKTRVANIKSMDYRCFRSAYNEARKCGFDEAILLNNQNEIVEGSRTNIFFIKRGIIYTPMVKCGCLNGITRQFIIQCARRLGLTCRAVKADTRKLFGCDEAFLTNSLMGVAPLTSVNNRALGRRAVGPVTQKIMNAYDTFVHFSCPP